MSSVRKKVFDDILGFDPKPKPKPQGAVKGLVDTVKRDRNPDGSPGLTGGYTPMPPRKINPTDSSLAGSITNVKPRLPLAEPRNPLKKKNRPGMAMRGGALSTFNNNNDNTLGA